MEKGKTEIKNDELEKVTGGINLNSVMFASRNPASTYEDGDDDDDITLQDASPTAPDIISELRS